MEVKREDTILVVSEREFLVNRNSLVENSPYFRAMLEGGFVEASSNRVELKGLGSAEAFEVFLDYILNKRVKLKDVSKILFPVLTLSDMLNDDMFPEYLLQELFKNWAELETAESILMFADILDARATLLPRIFSKLKNDFVERSRPLQMHQTSSQKREEPYLSVVDSSPGLVADIFGIDEAAAFCFSDFKDVELCFVKGVISWVHDKDLNELDIRNIVRCFGLQYLSEDSLMELISSLPQPGMECLLENQVKNQIEEVRNNIRKAVSTLCAGWAIDTLEMFIFNFGNWTWNLMSFDKIHNICTTTPTQPNIQMTNPGDTLKVSVSTWYTKSERFPPEVSCDVLPMYCSGVYVGDESQRLLIFELKHGEKRYSTIFRTPLPGRILGCHFLRLGDVLHGFVSYSLPNTLTTVSHFILKINSEDETWFNSEFGLKHILVDLPMRLTPVATAMSAKGILILFRRDQELLWLAVYNLETGLLDPLGHLPMPHKSEQCVPTPKEGGFDEKAKKICTFNFACCCCNTWAPIFHMSSGPDFKNNHETSPFFYGFDRCAINANHHTPQLKSVINVCYFTE